MLPKARVDLNSESGAELSRKDALYPQYVLAVRLAQVGQA